MTIQHNLRTATTTTGTTTVPKIRRSSGRNSPRRWAGPAALFAVAVTAFVGVDELRSTDDTPPTRPATVPAVSGSFEPLIGAEERAIINGEFPRMPNVDLCAMQKPC